MMHRIENIYGAEKIKDKLPKKIYEKLITDTRKLDEGVFDGCSLVLETKEDLLELRSVIDYTVHLSEETKQVSGYLSCLYLMNNEYSVNVFMPTEIAPKELMDEVEEE